MHTLLSIWNAYKTFKGTERKFATSIPVNRQPNPKLWCKVSEANQERMRSWANPRPTLIQIYPGMEFWCLSLHTCLHAYILLIVLSTQNFPSSVGTGTYVKGRVSCSTRPQYWRVPVVYDIIISSITIPYFKFSSSNTHYIYRTGCILVSL